MSISYSAVILDDTSRSTLLGYLADHIPEDWEVVAHHMTITMGPLIHPKGKHSFDEYAEFMEYDTPVQLSVISVGMSDRAMAIQVSPPFPISPKIKFPHVTVAVNRAGGGKPFHSNQIPPEDFKYMRPLGLVLTGHVEEISN